MLDIRPLPSRYKTACAFQNKFLTFSFLRFVSGWRHQNVLKQVYRVFFIPHLRFHGKKLKFCDLFIEIWDVNFMRFIFEMNLWACDINVTRSFSGFKLLLANSQNICMADIPRAWDQHSLPCPLLKKDVISITFKGLEPYNVNNFLFRRHLSLPKSCNLC